MANSQNKKNNSNKILIFSLVSVAVLLIISLAFNFLGEAKSMRVSTFSTLLGEDIEIKGTGYGSYSRGVIFSGETLEDLEYSQKVIFVCGNTDKNVVIRAKAKIDFLDVFVTMGGYTNWMPDVDNYIYFITEIKANERIGVCNFITFPDDISFKDDNNYILTFTIEVLPNEKAIIDNVWGEKETLINENPSV